MLALIPLFPFLGFLVNATLGAACRRASPAGLASLVMLASFAVSAISVWQLAGAAGASTRVEQTLYTWIASGDFNGRRRRSASIRCRR